MHDDERRHTVPWLLPNEGRQKRVPGVWMRCCDEILVGDVWVWIWVGLGRQVIVVSVVA